MWDQEREFSTRLGEEGFDLYLAWLDDEGQLQPIIMKTISAGREADCPFGRHGGQNIRAI
jgi:hypothetical protein